MNRMKMLASLAVTLIFVLLIAWASIRLVHFYADSSRTTDHPQGIVSNLFTRAEQRIRGGIGVVLVADQQSGLVKIHTVSAGSPAAAAGLKGDELISQIDGRSIKGVPLAEVASWMRRINRTELQLTVQKPASTNWQSVSMKRVSLKRAIELNSHSPYE